MSVWHGGSHTLPVSPNTPRPFCRGRISEAPTEQLAVKTVNGETLFFFGGGEADRLPVARSPPINPTPRPRCAFARRPTSGRSRQDSDSLKDLQSHVVSLG